MLSNLLEMLQRRLENYKIKLNDEKVKRLAETISYHSGGILPANVLQRELDIPYSQIHKLMSYLSTCNILRPVYRICCENDNFTGGGKIYYDLSDIPINICDRCEKECVILNNIVVEFEVLTDA